MEKVQLTDRLVHPIGLGTWHMGDHPEKFDQEVAALRAGIEFGAEVIDTAEMYGEGKSERLVGEAIAPYDREKLYLISKVYPWNASLQQLPLSLDNSLKRLKTDYLDLYLLHWTGNIPLNETVETLEKAKISGKIRAWGVSNFDTSDMEELFELPDGANCATNEVLYNLGSRGIDFDLLPWMEQRKMPLIAYSPVAQGDSLGDRLTEKKGLIDLAQKHGITVYQLLLAWSIRNGQTIAIPQSGNAKHVVENLKAAEVNLSQEDLMLIDSVYPKPTRKQGLAIL